MPPLHQTTDGPKGLRRKPRCNIILLREEEVAFLAELLP